MIYTINCNLQNRASKLWNVIAISFYYFPICMRTLQYTPLTGGIVDQLYNHALVPFGLVLGSSLFLDYVITCL